MSRAAADSKPSEPVSGSTKGQDRDRPYCMVVLALLPPYTIDDVHRAYKAGALKVHPDHGGKPEDFVKLRDAYEQAQEYVRFHSGRRDWLAAQVEPYMRMQEVISETERRGGTTEVESLEWMNNSFGDFSTLADRLRVIRYRGRDDGDDYLRFLADNHGSLTYLMELDLSGTRLTSTGLSRLKSIKALRIINLQNTNATATDVAAILRMPEIHALNIRSTRVNWWQRLRLGWKHPRIQWDYQSPSGKNNGGPSA
ncbi:MAG: hypothetical protein NT069_30535 [Planctomycetota bacterium]|nr:hypothetical protein [Planctomycetota bacterium]